ncbi:MAG: DUF1285 domain-containing protein [Hyphomonadaceae bacterium]|nr:DUF1285 domain-containing protein [Hyphomonadaceae bacterium]
MSVAEFIAALQREASSGASRGTPPVDRWDPPFCGDSFIEILADGTWRHEGVRMTRESLVRLFASILRKDADGITYLVTPVEKVRVTVADAPFVAVRADRDGAGRDQTIAFTTNVGDVVAAGPSHPIRVAVRDGAPRPYVLVRGRLEARILRAPFYELVDWAVEAETAEGPRLGVWSGGEFFPLGAVAASVP